MIFNVADSNSVAWPVAPVRRAPFHPGFTLHEVLAAIGSIWLSNWLRCRYRSTQPINRRRTLTCKSRSSTESPGIDFCQRFLPACCCAGVVAAHGLTGVLYGTSAMLRAWRFQEQSFGSIRQQ